MSEETKEIHELIKIVQVSFYTNRSGEGTCAF